MAIYIIIFAVIIIGFVVVLAKTDTSGGANVQPPLPPTPRASQSSTSPSQQVSTQRPATSYTPTPQKQPSVSQKEQSKMRRVDIKKVWQVAPLGSELYRKADEAFWRESKTMLVDEKEYNELNEMWHKYRDRKLALAKTAEYNNQGIELEKGNRIEEAIKIYEKAIALRYPATHAYDRLMILYRRIGQYEQEQRVINLAVEVFSEENKQRAEKAKLSNPEYAEQIDLALETNENVKTPDGKWVLCQYEVMKYFNRYAKAQALIDKRDRK